MARKREGEGFPSPFEVPVPPECVGWEEMYAYHSVFGEDRRAFDDGCFRFQDALHSPEPFYPFDAVWWEYGMPAFNQANARLFVVPPSLGSEYRMLNGYVYVSVNSVNDAETLARREKLFAKRGGHYYRHWPELYERWIVKVETTTRELETLVVPELPEVEDEAIVGEGRGIGSSHELLVAYDRLLEGLDRIMQYHFELVNLGYFAYLAFYDVCRQAFPDITDPTIARMVSAVDLLVLRPDEELKRLAHLALEVGVAEHVESAANEDELRACMAQTEAGSRWLADFDQTKDPWFYFSNGNGLYHHVRSWIDDTRLPIAAIGAYVRQLEAGEDISRPSSAVLAERERITGEHRAFLAEESRPPFEEGLALARAVYPFIEDHNFYIEHRYFTLSGTRCASSAPFSQGRSFSPKRRTSSSSGTTRCARHSRSSACTGAPAAPEPHGAPATGHLLSSGGRRSTRQCASGHRLQLSGRFPRRSPTRSRSCSGGSRTSAFRSGLSLRQASSRAR